MLRSYEQGVTVLSAIVRAFLVLLGIVLVPAFLVVLVVPLALAGMPIALVVLPFLVTSFWPERHSLRGALTRYTRPKMSVSPVLLKTRA